MVSDEKAERKRQKRDIRYRYQGCLFSASLALQAVGLNVVTTRPLVNTHPCSALLPWTWKHQDARAASLFHKQALFARPIVLRCSRLTTRDPQPASRSGLRAHGAEIFSRKTATTGEEKGKQFMFRLSKEEPLTVTMSQDHFFLVKNSARAMEPDG